MVAMEVRHYRNKYQAWLKQMKTIVIGCLIGTGIVAGVIGTIAALGWFFSLFPSLGFPISVGVIALIAIISTVLYVSEQCY